MPDISMCNNKECPLRLDCYRFMAIPNPHYQSMTTFRPDETGKCSYQWPIKDATGPIKELKVEKDESNKN